MKRWMTNNMKTLAIVMVTALMISTVNYTGFSISVSAQTPEEPVVEQSSENTSTEATTSQEVTTKKPEAETTTMQEVTTKKPEPETTTKKVKKIVPKAVTDLKATAVNTSEVELGWNEGKNATEYRVYRSVEKKDGKMSKAKKIKTLKKTSFKDKGLKQATKYEYSVYSYRVANKKTTHSKAVKIAVLTNPEPVSEVKITKVSMKSVSLGWKKNSKASKYIIYRSEEEGRKKFGAFKMLKEVRSSKDSFTDKTVAPGTLYRYKVIVKRTSKKTSVYSSAKTTEAAMTPLAAPKKLKKKSATANSIRIRWSKQKRADKYEVYRDGKLVKVTKKNSYTDKNIGINVTYEYSVKAVRTYKKKTYKSSAVSINAVTSDVSNGTWVEVSIEKQTLYMYVGDKLYVKTPVVTGNAGALSTTKGRHHVMSKESPRRLRGSYNGQSWDVVVNYWLRFTSDSQGIHDSTWRSAYGGTIYKGNGSHGCVNTPYSAMQKIYKKAYVGMPVIVH